MWKNLLNSSQEWLASHWHNFYFHWQLKDKTSFILLGVFAFVVITVPSFTYQLVQYKNTQQQIRCLALNVFHEARSESLKGQHAVAAVTLNRLASKHYPDTICEVVYEKRWDRIRQRYVGQFSWTEFDTPAKLKSASWRTALKVATASYKERNKKLLNGAIFYHTKYIKPGWSRKKKLIARIGNHIFYK